MRIGIFGGTFDPPHLAHLILAEEASFQLELDLVLWLLTPVSPFKSDANISPWEQRLDLLEAALGDNTMFSVSRVDVDRPGPHFAYESLNYLTGLYPDDQLIYLMGADSLLDLPRWKNPEELLSYCSQLGVMNRAGADINIEAIEKQVQGVQEKLTWVEAPLIEISGSMLRERLLNNLPVRYYLPEEVYRLILERNLYQAEN